MTRALPLALALGGLLTDQRLCGQPGTPPVAPEPASYRDVVKRVLPAVVSIEGKAAAKGAGAARAGGVKVAADAPPADTAPGFGSGVLIRPTGVVLTNNHVVQNAETVEVTLANGRKFLSRDIFRDPLTDLAVVRLAVPAGQLLPWVELADSDAVEVGDRVLAVGAPFGLTGSVTHGIVSATGRYGLNFNRYEDFIQTDAAVNPGSSGGALVGIDGKVIGITSAIKTRTGGFQGIALAISSNLSRVVADQLVETGTVRRGCIGVELDPVPADAAARLGLTTGGVLVAKVKEDGPAAVAKVERGDVIVAAGGRRVKDIPDLQRVVATLPVGKPAEVRVVRDGAELAFQVMVVKKADDPPPGKPVPPPMPPAGGVTVGGVGLGLTDLTPALVAERKFPKAARGVLVAAVTPRSLAETSGLTRGLVVLKVDGTAVSTAAGFAAALARAEKGKGAVLQVLKSNGETNYVLLRLQ